MNNDIIPYGKQQITEEDIKAVSDVLRSDYLTQGPSILEFENKFCNYIGCKYAVAVTNGTAALHLAALALGVSKGDRVVTTPLTFAASANCIKYCEGEVVFVDIDPETYLIDINKIEEAINSQPFGTFKGIVSVDFAGRAVNLEQLRKIADKYQLWIIQDACHSPGGYFIDSKGEKQNCGNGNYADLAVFSFHPVKHIATGEGGMITTNNIELYKKLLELRTHGITKDRNKFLNFEFAYNIGQSKVFPGWYMEMQHLGFNYRMSDIQAALGISQLKRAESNLELRKKIASKYEKAFFNKKFIKGQSGYVHGHAYHLFIIEVENRLGLYEFLKSRNIFCQVHYIPCHLMPYYQNFGWKKGDMPNAEKYYQNCLSIPMYPSLRKDEIEKIISAICEFYE